MLVQGIEQVGDNVAADEREEMGGAAQGAHA